MWFALPIIYMYYKQPQQTKEIRSYVSPRLANGAVGYIAACFLIMAAISVLVGRMLETWPLFVLIGAILYFVWLGIRRGTFIAIDSTQRTLRGSGFFLRGRAIPIEAITRINARGIFLGAWTTMTVTYRKPGGNPKTVEVGIKEGFQNFDRILDVLVDINPKLRIPSELRQ